MLKVAERCFFSSPKQLLPEFADCRKVEPAEPRLVERLKKEVIQQECGIEGVVLFGERHLRYVIKEFMAHYHRERFHQGLGGS